MHIHSQSSSPVSVRHQEVFMFSSRWYSCSSSFLSYPLSLCWFSLFILGLWDFNPGFLDHHNTSPHLLPHVTDRLIFLNFHYINFPAPKPLISNSQFFITSNTNSSDIPDSIKLSYSTYRISLICASEKVQKPCSIHHVSLLNKSDSWHSVVEWMNESINESINLSPSSSLPVDYNPKYCLNLSTSTSATTTLNQAAIFFHLHQYNQ